VPMRYDDIEQHEVLWIAPETCYLPELPDGFALRVDDFLGPGLQRPATAPGMGARTGAAGRPGCNPSHRHRVRAGRPAPGRAYQPDAGPADTAGDRAG